FFSGLIFGIILPIYIMSMLCKKIFRHYKRQEDDDDPLVVDENWIADRMENPQEYDERHVSVRLDDLTKATDKPIDEPNQPITISTTVTYGSV
uniref:Uncharacterized protein n=1 Tax=Amphimedon queenslandica TaxID=400682 RepID=A0A1X7UQC7_AMPQE